MRILNNIYGFKSNNNRAAVNWKKKHVSGEQRVAVMACLIFCHYRIVYNHSYIFKRILLFKRDYLNTEKKIESIRVIRYYRYCVMVYTQVFSHLNAILCSFNWIQFLSLYLPVTRTYKRYVYIYTGYIHSYFFATFEVYRTPLASKSVTYFRIGIYYCTFRSFGRYKIVDIYILHPISPM